MMKSYYHTRYKKNKIKICSYLIRVFIFFFFWMAQKKYDQDDFLISSLVIQWCCSVLVVLAYNTVEVVLLLQFLEASRVNGVYMASSIYPRQKECFISLLRARRKAVCGGQRLYIWLWLPYSTRYYQFRYFCPAKNSKQTASSKQQEYISSSERL